MILEVPGQAVRSGTIPAGAAICLCSKGGRVREFSAHKDGLYWFGYAEYAADQGIVLKAINGPFNLAQWEALGKSDMA